MGLMAAGESSAHAAHSGSSVQQTAPPLPPLKRHPVVALTFDDLPAAGGLHPGFTRTGIATQLSDELKAAHLKGVYGFVNAVGVSDDPDLQQALRVWVGAGMNIGNHTWSHPALSDVGAAAFEQNIAENEPTLREYAGKRDWLHDHGYRIAEVTLNFNDDDWDDPYGRCLAKHDEVGIAWLKQSYMQNAAEFIRLGREEEQLAFGHEIPSVLLLHGTSFTTLMLPSLLHLLHQEGFRIASLRKVESNPAYALNPNIGLPDGDPFSNEFLDARHMQYPPFKPEPVQQLNSVCQ
jgi:peptidoglycan/xylan/chitin deacetylase (PgdA/CDA1 family)